MGRPLLIFAMPAEERPFERAAKRRPTFRLERTSKRACLSWSGGTLDVALTGVGQHGVERLLAREAPSEVLHAGFAGGLSDRVERFGTYRIDRIRRAQDVVDVPATRFAAALAPLELRSIVTVPLMLGAADKATMRKDGAADLVDMESWWVMAWCRERGIPYTGVRAVTDLCADEIPEAVRDAYDGRDFHISHVLGAALTTPSLWAPLLELKRRADRAGRVLAEVLLDAIERR